MRKYLHEIKGRRNLKAGHSLDLDSPIRKILYIAKISALLDKSMKFYRGAKTGHNFECYTNDS
jgi:hypothetical protein